MGQLDYFVIFFSFCLWADFPFVWHFLLSMCFLSKIVNDKDCNQVMYAWDSSKTNVNIYQWKQNLTHFLGCDIEILIKNGWISISRIAF